MKVGCVPIPSWYYIQRADSFGCSGCDVSRGAILFFTKAATPPEGRLAAECWKERGCEMTVYPGEDTSSSTLHHVSQSKYPHQGRYVE